MNEYNTTIGIDLGDEYSAICVLDSEGEIMEQSQLRTTREVFRKRFKSMDNARIILETGTHSRWSSALLKKLGHEVIVANARRLRMIFKNENKTDKVDAQMLARVGRYDVKLLSGITHRGDKAHQDLEIIKTRNFLVEQRTSTVVRIRSIVKSFGHSLPACGATYFWKKTREHLPTELEDTLGHLYDILELLNEKIQHYDAQIEALAKNDYATETQLLRAIPGVGPLTSMSFILIIEDPYRFIKSRDVGSYFGLRPRLDQSGDKDPQLPITKCGNGMMRRLLVQASHHILGHRGPDCDLRRFGMRIAERGGKRAKKRAVIAVARKLSVLLHRLWVDGEIYDPFYNAKRRGEVTP
jgi:transposase